MSECADTFLSYNSRRLGASSGSAHFEPADILTQKSHVALHAEEDH